MGDRSVSPLFASQYNEGKITSPKQLTIKTCSEDKAIEINRMCHSRLPIIDKSNVLRNTHRVCFCAIHGDTYYASAIWTSPVAQNRFKDGKTILELRRMAIFDDAPRNTATYMLGKMIKYIKKYLPEIIRLISYQDTEVHSGTIYKAGNWVSTAESSGLSWSTDTRKRNKEQTRAVKIRWEYKVGDWA